MIPSTMSLLIQQDIFDKLDIIYVVSSVQAHKRLTDETGYLLYYANGLFCSYSLLKYVAPY